MRSAYLPDTDASQTEMKHLQRSVAEEAIWTDAHSFDISCLRLRSDARTCTNSPNGPLIAGIDQAFTDEKVISAVVVGTDDCIVEKQWAVSECSIAYIPGLLSFHEAPSIFAALEKLQTQPELLVCDGSGRIHYRQAGLATHVGVVMDRPAIGVAKNLLCGSPVDSVERRPAEWQTPVVSDAYVENATSGTVLGHAYQSRQYDTSRRINPVYVSPGHRVAPETATTCIAHLCDGYKLPEPTRQADAFAATAKQRYLDGQEPPS